jgi:hypothetical protein
VYTSSEGIIRKILVTPETVEQLDYILLGDEASMSFIEEKKQSIRSKNGYQYINIPRYSDVTLYSANIPKSIDFTSWTGDEAIVFGAYANEGGHCWCAKNLKINLLVGDKPLNGIEIKLVASEYWFIANEGKAFELDIIVDGKRVEYLVTARPDAYELFVDPTVLPEKESNSIYIIELKANGYFNPSKMPDIFGQGYADNRELAFMLYYLGEVE